MTSNLPCVQDMRPYETWGKWYNHFYKYLLSLWDFYLCIYLFVLFCCRLCCPIPGRSNRKHLLNPINSERMIHLQGGRASFMHDNGTSGWKSYKKKKKTVADKQKKQCRKKGLWFFCLATQKTATKWVHFLITTQSSKNLKTGIILNYTHVDGIKLARQSTWRIGIALLLTGYINLGENELMTQMKDCPS